MGKNILQYLFSGYLKLLKKTYRQCMERKEEMRDEEHTKSGKEHSAVSVLRLFKTS